MAKGFDDWIEIFKGGPQRDSAGREHDGDALIDKAVASFNAAEHEPPAVIGHPTENGPAFGWVAELKAEAGKGGKTLLAKFREVVPEFADMVQRGLFKKRSASFYPDGRLRHVGFLGAMPPAVKGLADIGFSASEEAVVFEFGDELGMVARFWRRLREFLIEKFGQDAADQVVADWEINDLRDMANRPETENAQAIAYSEAGQDEEEKHMGTTTFSEADLKKAKEEAASTAREDERKKVMAEFAEQQKIKAAAARKTAIAAFCEAGVKNGTLPPAWIDAGIQQYMERQNGDESISFAEGGKAQTDLEWFQGFIGGLGKLIDFGEIATRGKNVGGDGNAGEQISALVKKKMEVNDKLTFSEALSAVQAENPTLAQEYAQELGIGGDK